MIRIMPSSQFVIIPTAIVLVVFLAIRRRYSARLHEIPGPFLASFSVLWQVWHVIKGDIEWETIRLHEKHGLHHIIFLTSSTGVVPWLMTSRALCSHQSQGSQREPSRCNSRHSTRSAPQGKDNVERHTSSGYADVVASHQADWYKVMALPDHRFQTPMSEVDPKRQVARAKNIASAYTLTNLLKAEKYMDQLIELLVTRLGQLADAQKPVEFDKWFNYMAFDIVGELAFSSPFGFLESGKDIGGSIENTRVLTLYTAVAGFFVTLHQMTLGNPLVTKLGLMPSQHIFDTTLRAIEKRKSNPDVQLDMLEHWKRMVAKNSMEENELYGVTNMTIGAGADTISATLQAFFYYLIRHPKHLDRVRAEVLSAKTSKVVSYGEAQGLPFLQACVGLCPLPCFVQAQ